MKRHAAFVFCFLAGAVARAESPADDTWAKHWSECSDLKLPYFQGKLSSFRDFVQEGTAWEASVAKEKQAIDRVAQVTCKKWAENPNGDVPLQEFLRDYTSISKSALEIKRTADTVLAPRIAEWWKKESFELVPFGFRFETFPCGRAFLRTKLHVQSEIQGLENRFYGLRKQCPRAAEEVIARAKARGFSVENFGKGEGSPARAASPPPGARSDITGAEKARTEEVAGEKILQQRR